MPRGRQIRLPEPDRFVLHAQPTEVHRPSVPGRGRRSHVVRRSRTVSRLMQPEHPAPARTRSDRPRWCGGCVGPVGAHRTPPPRRTLLGPPGRQRPRLPSDRLAPRRRTGTAPDRIAWSHGVLRRSHHVLDRQRRERAAPRSGPGRTDGGLPVRLSGDGGGPGRAWASDSGRWRRERAVVPRWPPAGGTAVRTVLLSLNDRVPWGTLAVNLGGSFVLGLLVGADATPVAVAIGGVGSLTTWSRFAAGLVERRDETAPRCALPDGQPRRRGRTGVGRPPARRVTFFAFPGHAGRATPGSRGPQRCPATLDPPAHAGAGIRSAPPRYGRRISGISDRAVGLAIHLDQRRPHPGHRQRRAVERVHEHGLPSVGAVPDVGPPGLVVGEPGHRRHLEPLIDAGGVDLDVPGPRRRATEVAGAEVEHPVGQPQIGDQTTRPAP